MSRRWALVVAAGVLVAGAALAFWGYEPTARLPAPEPGEVAAERLPDSTPVFVSREGDEVWVVDARVPHWLDEGVEVYAGFCAGARVGWEPFYWTEFDRAGHYLGGPAPRGLAGYEAELEGDSVIVGASTPPPERGADPVERTGSSAAECEPWGHPGQVHHHAGMVEQARAPEEVAAATAGGPELVLAAVERVGDRRRACAWEPESPAAGPLCGDDAPEVAPSPFAFLAEDWPGDMYGSYGLYLMTSRDGVLVVRGVLPEQMEYTDAARRLPGAGDDDAP